MTELMALGVPLIEVVRMATSNAATRIGLPVRLGRRVLLPLGCAVLLTLAWQVLCRIAAISPVLLPPPSSVWTVLSQNYAILFAQAVPTTYEIVVSFAIATLLGIGLAVAITFSAWVREALYPRSASSSANSSPRSRGSATSSCSPPRPARPRRFWPPSSCSAASASCCTASWRSPNAQCSAGMAARPRSAACHDHAGPGACARTMPLPNCSRCR
jgi:hypothetical protein